VPVLDGEITHGRRPDGKTARTRRDR
jgi:hypothetical protein